MGRDVTQLTDGLISHIGLTIPIDLNKIISYFSDIEIEYDSDISKDGLIKFDQEKGYLIQIKNKELDIDNPKGYRDRFTIAHELGHLFLEHLGEQKELFREGTGEAEYEANDFAANLLMPKAEFIECVYNNLDEEGLCDLGAVSDYFKVSVSAVKTRGKFLGVFSW